MGKITSIYLTDEEVAELKKFCNENECTQYSALKTALRELLSKPVKEAEDSSPVNKEKQAQGKKSSPLWDLLGKLKVEKERA